MLPAASALARVQAELYARWPESSVAPTLERMRTLAHLLGDPQLAFPSVHVAGTNGKTSTTRFIDALLRETGLRTGRYTSPHLESVTERIALDGVPLSAERFVAAYAEVAGYLPSADAATGRTLSFFEVLTGMAFATFADAPVDVAVVEVGLGGGWDATNLVHGPVEVITPVDLDHTRLLGDTVARIAAEKAGILKPGAVAVLGPQHPEGERVIAERADELGVPTVRYGRDFGVAERAVAVGGQLLTLAGVTGTFPEVFLPLHGAHQAVNAACALVAVEEFLGRRELDPDIVRAAFAGADSPGRMEVVRRSPTILLDAAHNPAGARALAAALPESFSFDRVIAVLGVFADKDVAGLLAELEPVVDLVVATASSSPRALPAVALADAARQVFGPDRVRLVAELDAALEEAVRAADEDFPGVPVSGTAVLVTGSVTTVGEARHLLRGAPVAGP
jgi:dihydrofolate synthase/folylpolyglutamate synthase